MTAGIITSEALMIKWNWLVAAVPQYYETCIVYHLWKYPDHKIKIKIIITDHDKFQVSTMGAAKATMHMVPIRTRTVLGECGELRMTMSHWPSCKCKTARYTDSSDS
jgi:hypothetical protein